MDYRNKAVLAPMVRIGTLPMRLLAIRYGADLVYSPEIIAHRLAKCTRVVNGMHRLIAEKLSTVDFVDPAGTLALRVHPSEQARLIVQIGSADPLLALLAARKVESDVAGIDLNCGCPKRFSVQGGMGSALLETPDILMAVLESLVQNLSIPVTCKIRLLCEKAGLSASERTILLLQRIEATGVKAIGIHARFTHERPREPAHWKYFETLSRAISIPIIANGDIYSLRDAKELTSMAEKITSFMFARAAQNNPSVFREDGPLPYRIVMLEYLKLGIQFDMRYDNIKYALLQMGYPEDEKVEFKQKMIRCKTISELLDLVEGAQLEE